MNFFSSLSCLLPSTHHSCVSAQGVKVMVLAVDSKCSLYGYCKFCVVVPLQNDAFKGVIFMGFNDILTLRL